jgi:hypothetical protein
MRLTRLKWLYSRIAHSSQQVFFWLRDTWHVSRHLWVILTLQSIGAFAFIGVDQATDLFIYFIEQPLNRPDTGLITANDSYYLKFWFFLILWSFTSWRTARIYLQLVSIQADDEERVCRFILWMPRLLGLLPYLIAAAAFRKAGESWLGFHMLMCFFTGLGYGFYVLFRRKLRPRTQPLRRKQLEWWEMSVGTRRIIYGLLSGLLLFFWLMVLAPRSWGLAEWFRPAGIVTAALCTWTVVGVTIQYLAYRLRFPLFGVLIGLVVFSSFFNDNHAVRLAEEEAPYTLPTDTAYLRGWLQSRIAEIGQDSVYPVYIVATEGGGIRSAYWTASVLARLDSLNPAFYRHTFAISGVSGGSVGAAVFHALYHNYRLYAHQPEVSLVEKARQILGEDHLSGVTSALLYPDLVQRFLPAKIPSWDRARWLEDSWSYAYRKHTQTPNVPKGLATLDSSFASLWSDQPDYRLPSLFLNSTVVETGQKAITANVRLSPFYFADIVDVSSVLGKSPLLKTAASGSSRFPYITPPATLPARNSDALWGHIVDGGYFENTGLSTAVEILNLMSSQLHSVPSSDFPLELRAKIRPHILYIRNNAYQPESTTPMRGMHETRTPLTALLNAWDRGGVATSIDVRRVVRQLQIPAGFDVYELKRDARVTLPLGWFLSETARTEINGQLDTLARSLLP